MAKAIVHCRICKEAFDRLALIRDVDFVNPTNKVYYHKACYDEYLQKKSDVHSNMDDELWFEAVWDFMTKELKGCLNYYKVKHQWETFLKQKMTGKGIYFGIKYFYGIKGNSVHKCEEGIGIIPYIYEESHKYWREREQREQGILASIEKQLAQAAAQKTVAINLKKKSKKTINREDRWKEIEMSGDEE